MSATSDRMSATEIGGNVFFSSPALVIAEISNKININRLINISQSTDREKVAFFSITYFSTPIKAIKLKLCILLSHLRNLDSISTEFFLYILYVVRWGDLCGALLSGQTFTILYHLYATIANS